MSTDQDGTAPVDGRGDRTGSGGSDGPAPGPLVLGVGLLAVAVAVLLSALTDIVVDVGALVSFLLVAAGAVLVVTSVTTGLRRR